MRYSTILEELSATPLFIFGVFLLLLVLMHLVLVFWMKLGEVAWKLVDYVWLFTAVLGLLAASAQSDHFLSKRYLATFERPRTETAYKLLRSTLDSYPTLCAPRHRSPVSPPDFDEMVEEQQALCKRAKEIAAKMPLKITDDFPLLEQTGYEDLNYDAKYETYYVHAVSNAAEQYRQQQRRYAEFVAAGAQSGSEEMLTVLGPLLLAFALSLRITKVSGDIRNARIKNLANQKADTQIGLSDRTMGA
jgi:hypothetical protein